MSTTHHAPPRPLEDKAVNGLSNGTNVSDTRHLQPPQVRQASATSLPSSTATASATPARASVIDRYHKRGRVESAGNEGKRDDNAMDARAHAATMVMMSGSKSGMGADIGSELLLRDRFGSPRRGPTWLGVGVGARRRAHGQRSSSLPNIYPQKDDAAIHNIFPDLNPRELRLAEVRSWYCPWRDHKDEAAAPVLPAATVASQQQHTGSTTTTANALKPKLNGKSTKPRVDTDDFDTVLQQIADELSLEDKPTTTTTTTTTKPPSGTPPVSSTPLKRPVLRLKLEDMPTPQQAEDRANRAATRIIARREAVEKAMNENGETAADGGGDGAVATTNKSATQQAIMRLNFKSYSSGDDSDVASPSGRHSVGSAYSPNHGMFTTKMVAVSEAGISSPDSASLHLQENLERVKEIGRGASGVVYKSIHIPTLKVVAVKDVPVYGRGQRRQMVRELHALYSNLVPIATDEEEKPSTTTQNGARPHRPSNGKPRPSPHIVSFYDAFVDRAKNCICLVMEYMSAGSLQDIVLRGGCQNEKVLARLATGVLRGLSHIHSKRMVHRDIKPHNLLANRQGDVKISDFGLAKTLNDNGGMTKTFVGTLLYMAPERIGGGDYSYPADIWSFGLALVSVALGKYPLPTQDGFFGLVDSVANEQYLELPADTFSAECRDFIQLCLKTEPSERPSAEQLLLHPFMSKYTSEETLQEWMAFIDTSHLCEDRDVELESLAEAVYRHMYERNVKFSCQPQSDYGVSFMAQTRVSQTFPRREMTIHPVQMSLQLGLANYLGVPVHTVYERFEVKRGYYNDKLLEDYCFSPQSWTASPGVARRQQLFGSDCESPRPPEDRSTTSSGSFWRKIQDGLTKLKSKKKKTTKDTTTTDGSGAPGSSSTGSSSDRWSLRTASR